MSDLSAAQQKLESALQRLESAIAADGEGAAKRPPSGDSAEALRMECESLRSENRKLEVEIARLKEENVALGDCNAAAAGRVDEVLNRLKGVLAEQAA